MNGPMPAMPDGCQAVTVLVVDDQQAYRDAAQFVIEMSERFEIIGLAESGEEGIALTGELRPDLVLMDINMPGIDGLDATRHIVANHPASEVIVFSTHSATDYQDIALKAGAIGFISKAELAPDVLDEVWNSARHDPGK